jgi:hypothetical protein
MMVRVALVIPLAALIVAPRFRSPARHFQPIALRFTGAMQGSRTNAAGSVTWIDSLIKDIDGALKRRARVS